MARRQPSTAPRNRPATSSQRGEPDDRPRPLAEPGQHAEQQPQECDDAQRHGDQPTRQPGHPRVITHAQAQPVLRTEQHEHDSGDEQRTDPGRSSGVEQGTVRRAPSTQQPDQGDQHELADQHEQDQSWSALNQGRQPDPVRLGVRQTSQGCAHQYCRDDDQGRERYHGQPGQHECQHSDRRLAEQQQEDDQRDQQDGRQSESAEPVGVGGRLNRSGRGSAECDEERRGERQPEQRADRCYRRPPYVGECRRIDRDQCEQDRQRGPGQQAVGEDASPVSTFRDGMPIIESASGSDRGDPESRAGDDHHAQRRPYDCEIRTGVVASDGQ